MAFFVACNKNEWCLANLQSIHAQVKQLLDIMLKHFAFCSVYGTKIYVSQNNFIIEQTKYWLSLFC